MLINVTFSLDNLMDEIKKKEGHESAKEQMVVSTANESGWSIRVNDKDKLTFAIYSNERGRWEGAALNFKLSKNTKYNVTAIYERTDNAKDKIKIYVNGEKKLENEVEKINFTQESGISTMIGANPYYNNVANSDGYLFGKVYNVRLWYDVKEWFNDSINEDKIVEYLYEQAINN